MTIYPSHHAKLGGPEGLIRGAGFHLIYQITAKVTEPDQSVTEEQGNVILKSY